MPPAPLSPHSWLLPLGPERSLQRVEVVFDADTRQCPTDQAAEPELAEPGMEAIGTTLPLSATRRRFRAPRLGDLPVEQTRWTIAGPASLAPGVIEPAAADDANALLTGRPPQPSRRPYRLRLPPCGSHRSTTRIA